MPTYGELQSVLLYRDVPQDRWRWCVYDTEGVWDGFLPELSAAVEFDEARARLDDHVRRHWKQSIEWPWLEDNERPDWWTAGPPHH